MNISLPDFHLDRRRCADTKLAEVISGAFAIAYGIQAFQPGTSQWKVLLTMEGGAFMWGGVLMFCGALSILFAYSTAYKSRFAIALVAFMAWAAVVLLFSQSAISGPPLYNGLILMAVAVRVMIGAFRHEKQTRAYI